MTPPALNHLDFNLLLDLDALLREGSVVGAARALHLSPPAMSRRLMRLREALGDPLFVPAGRGLVPTQRALALGARARAAIEEVRGVFAPVALDLNRLQRHFCIRANDGFAGVWAARLATALHAVAPGVTLQFVARADKSMEALRSGSVDLDLGAPTPPEPDIHREGLFDAALVGVVRAGHPLMGKRATKNTRQAVSAKAFVAWLHIATERQSLSPGRLDAALQAQGLQRRVGVVAPGFQTALVMAATSDMVASMPEPFVRWAMAHHRLQVFALPVALPRVEVSQRWHARHQADPAHAWLREQVRAQMVDPTQINTAPAAA